MQKLSGNDAEQILKRQAELWQQMKSRSEDEKSKPMIHIEFADFNDEDFFALYDKYVIRHADSLGMNEQELQMALDHWNNKQNLKEAKNSKPRFEDVIKQLKQFFEKSKQMKTDISRVHLHPYGSFFMCYDPRKWQDAKEAMIKSSLAVPHYCVHPSERTDLVKEADTFELLDMPKSFDHPNRPGEQIKINKDQLLYAFDLNDDIKCYLQFSIKCQKVFKTAGLGDTISSVGFIYHQPLGS